MNAADAGVGAQFVIRVEEPFTRERIAAYAHASGDMSQIHFDEEFARASGLDGIIAHGVFVLSVMVETVLAQFGPGAEAPVVDVRFGRAFPAGDHLLIQAEVTAAEEEPGRRAATVTLVGLAEGDRDGRPCVQGEVRVVIPA